MAKGSGAHKLALNKCTHDRYRSKNYMCHPKALKDVNIAWVGVIEKTCKDCGADIESAKRAPVLTAEEYLRGLGVDHGQNKGMRKRG